MQRIYLRNAQKVQRQGVSVGEAVMALQISMIIWMDDIPLKVMLFMRGCVGTGAIIFVVLVGILTYKVNSHHLRSQRRGKSGR